MNTEFLQKIALSVANEQSIGTLLQRIVTGLAHSPNTVLSRIWLIKPGDICNDCFARDECPDQRQCLHLVASDGTPHDPNSPRPKGLNGKYRRFPIGIRKVGKIGASGKGVLLTDVDQSPSWLKEPDWARSEAIQSFAGQPLLFRGELFGVLVIFSRNHLRKADFEILHAFANNAAAAYANARAFEENKRLRDKLESENEYLRGEVHTIYTSKEIVGSSPSIRHMLEKIVLVAQSNTTVLIQGESGTGKELVAREIHRRSARKNLPMIRVNCAAIPKELFESEFFGHIKGSFTGAVKDRRGRFQIADKGTLFLDEIGEVPLDLQVKLLRVLQEGEFEPIGDGTSYKTDVRIIAATNSNLKKSVKEGKFREDLYYRLSVFPIDVPPLRERGEDIALLASHFLNLLAEKLEVPLPTLKEKHVKSLRSYHWPGNVRELENTIERALILSRNSSLSFEGLSSSWEFEKDKCTDHNSHNNDTETVLTFAQMKQRERENIVAALKLCNWKIRGADGAASLLAVKPTTLASRIKAMNITR